MKKYFKNIIYTVIIILIATSKTFAGSVDSTFAKIIAKNFYYEMASAKKTIVYNDLQLSLADTRIENNQVIYYVYNLNNNGGWIIISAESNINPIIAFSLNGTFSNVNLPPAYSDWMNNYKDQILYVKQNSISADSSITNRWNKYASVSNTRQNILSVDSLLTSNWDQSNDYNAYYNKFCPIDANDNSGHDVTGCVATAMGQVMRYWGYDRGYNFPSQGIGTHSYSDPINYYNDNTTQEPGSAHGTQSVDFCNTTYDWVNMSDNKLTSSSTQAQINAVATLLYSCGVSVDMNYGPATCSSGALYCTGSGAWGNGADSAIVANALKNYFGYASTAQNKFRSDYPNGNDWNNILINEINNNRPVIYAGYGTGGHAFVCDGYYTTSGYYHFNFGWSGICDGYFYYLDNLTPSAYGQTHDYSNNQQAVIGIQPGAYISMYSNFSLAPNPIIQGQPLNVSVDLANYGAENFNGNLFLGLYNATTYAYSETIEQINGSQLTAGYYNTFSFSTSNITSPPGNYLLYLFYEKNGTTCWIQAPENLFANPLTIQVTAQPLVANFTASPTTLCIGNSVNFSDLTTGSPTGWSWNFGDGNSSTSQNPSHTYNTAGTYTVSLTVTNATSSDSYSINSYITVNALPSTAATPTGTTSLCQDAPNTNFTTSGASNANSYVWSISPSGAGTISGGGTTGTVNWNASFASTATISVYGVNSCGNGVSSNALTVTVNPLPAQPTISANGNQLTSSAANTYQWYFNGGIISGATSQTYIATQSGNYYIVVTNSNGCSSTSAPYSYNVTTAQPFVPEVVATAGDYFVYGSVSLEYSIGEVVIETYTGTQTLITQGFHQAKYVITMISEIASDDYSISVYPNPTSDNITIDISARAGGNLKLKLFDAQGKLLINEKVKSEEKTKIINLQTFSKGVYLLNIYNDQDKQIKSYKIEKIN